MIDYINSARPLHIVTIEDPIEVLHPDKKGAVNQREVGIDTKSFVAAMRSAMRQNPDVIFIGEMRDVETVQAALAAAETGHLVLLPLHIIDAAETVNRIVDFFPPFQQHQVRVTLAGALKGILCQRLVPRSGGAGSLPWRC
jgi:twitching motility protein PilT